MGNGNSSKKQKPSQENNQLQKKDSSIERALSKKHSRSSQRLGTVLDSSKSKIECNI